MAYTNKNNVPKFGLCIDWETTGADFGKDSSLRYQGITFGAIVFDTQTFQEIEKIYVEVKFNSGTVKNDYEWTEGAQKIHGKTREYLDANGVTMEDAAIKLLELIVKYFSGTKVVFLGHNPEFDIRFTAQLLREIGVEFSVERKHEDTLDTWIEIHHVVLNTSALGFITLGIFKSDQLFERIGFEKRGEHNALTDAEYTLQTCAAIKTLVETGLGSL